MFHVEHAFGVRFGYLCWLRHLKTGEAPTFAEIGRAVGRTGPAVGAWLEAEDPPSDYRIHDPLAAYFGAEKRWILEGAGDPPGGEELWKVWLRHRRTQPKRLSKDSFMKAAKPEAAAAKKTPRAREA